MSKGENDVKTSASANSKKLALVLMAAAFMLCGTYIVAVGAESTDAVIHDGDIGIHDGDTGIIHTTWNSGNCVVTYDSQWMQKDSAGLVQIGDGILKVSGNGPMEDYHHVDHTDCSTTPWIDRAAWASPYYGCNKLIIEEGVTHIGSFAFFCLRFSEVVLPSTLTSIGNSAFERTELKSIVIPDTVTKMGDGIFKDCTQLTSVKLPNGIKELGLDVFYGAPIPEIELPSSIRALNGTFANSGIKSIVIPDGVTKIASRTFSRCSDLKTVVLPDSVTAIEEWSFDGSGITEIKLDNIKSIGNGAFKECESLKCVILPEGLESLGSSAFENCTSLEYAYIPDNFKEIPGCLFRECKSLKTIVLPASIESIEGHAFAGTPLEYVNIPDSVKSIGACAFSSNSLTSVVIPASVKSIDTMAFTSETLKYISIEGTDVDLGFFTFLCANLETFNAPAINDPQIASKYMGSFTSMIFYESDKTTKVEPVTAGAIGGYTWTSIGAPEKGSVYKIPDPKPETLTYTWMNYDGTILQKTTGVPLNEWPSYEGEDPVNKFGLTFCGWNSVEDRYGNVFLLATYQVGDVTDVGGDDGMGGEDDSPDDDTPKMIATVIVLAVTAIFIAAVERKG